MAQKDLPAKEPLEGTIISSDDVEAFKKMVPGGLDAPIDEKVRQGDFSDFE